MGMREFSLLLFFIFLRFASSSSFHNTLSNSEVMQMEKENGTYNNGSKIEESGRRGGANGHGGEQGGSDTQAGSGVIPVYAANANERRHQNHHASNNVNDLHNIQFPTLLLIVITSSLLSYFYVS